MVNVLIFNYQIPYPEHFSGNTVRVLPLSRELAKTYRCFLVCFGEKDERYYALKRINVYEDICVIPPPEGPRSFLRHFCINTGDQTRFALPKEYSRVTKSLNALIEGWNIDLVVVHTSGLAEYLFPFSAVPKVIDAIDCNTLALARFLQHKEKERRGLIVHFKEKIALRRKKYLESKLPEIFDIVTVTSHVDRDYLRELCSRNKERILAIPNGIDPKLLSVSNNINGELMNSIAFWGALDFEPNRTAIHYFYENVFAPFLSGKSVIWFIIGKNPSQKMREMAKEHPNIKVTGFVDNLFEFVSQIPIVINPMVIGGGIKNKVLEAFALRRLVISNKLGIEAIGAKNGVHYIHAETPKEFSDAILNYLTKEDVRKEIGRNAAKLIQRKYTWGKIGQKYTKILDKLVLGRRRG